MTLTLEVPENVVARAAELGVPVNELVLDALEVVVSNPERVHALGSAMSRAQATAAIKDIASRHTLGGLKIKDLIEEGRRL